MPTIIFVLVCGIIVFTSYYISHDMINIVSVFTVPYIVIVPINNFIMIKRGFYMISEQVLCLIGGSLFCIFVGYIAANTYLKLHKRANIYQEQELEKKFSCHRMQAMLRYVIAVEILVTIRLICMIFTNGLAYISTENFAGYMMSGPLGHLLLTIYPLVPILFLYWLKNMKQALYLITTIVCIGLLFTTFVKYHVVGIIVLIYFFVSLEDRKYLCKGLIIVSVTAISAFILNYFVTFLLRGTASRASQDYYFNHLWNYMAGSLIHDNLIFTSGINVGMSSVFKFARAMLTPFYVLAISLLDISIEPLGTVTHIIDFVPMGTNGEWGNIIDAFGYFFPSKGNSIEIILHFIILILIGLIFTLLYNNLIKESDKFHITISVILDFFCFFSFFGIMYNLLPPWEILVYSIVLPKLFDCKTKIRFWR